MPRQVSLLCFIFAVGLILPNLPGSSAGTCGCPPLWTSFQGMCYRKCDVGGGRKTSFTKPCWDEGATTGQLGHLVSIHSQEEMDFLITLFESVRNKRVSGNQQVWIGLNDKTTEGSFAWSDGSEVDYTFWAPNEPNNHSGAQDCAHFSLEFKHMWDDLQCDPSDVDESIRDAWIVGGYVCKLGEWL
ncbi:echinoidin-like [Diadema antillarum]|uniref:echinoidin-like n=1 Tax=Diadema antillarum TaxID=105358 RepID=UPI003A8411EE